MENSDPQDDLSQRYTHLLVKKWPFWCSDKGSLNEFCGYCPYICLLLHWEEFGCDIFCSPSCSCGLIPISLFARLQKPSSLASCLKLCSLRLWPSCLPSSGACFFDIPLKARAQNWSPGSEINPLISHQDQINFCIPSNLVSPDKMKASC